VHDRPIVFSPSAPGSVEMAVDVLVNGGVLAMPTDTVYGLAASLSHPDAIDRIFSVKNRDRTKPLPILVSSTEALEHLVPDLDPDVSLLLDEYWPGPLTVVVRPAVRLPAQVVAADGTVGIRLPNHQLAIELIERAGGAIACTSANVSGDDPERTANDVLATLGSLIDAVIDGGIAPGGVSSTVIGFGGCGVVVYRDGAIPSEHIIASWEALRQR
jgi:L-threonylcarbamoyladenylate synthase